MLSFSPSFSHPATYPLPSVTMFTYPPSPLSPEPSASSPPLSFLSHGPSLQPSLYNIWRPAANFPYKSSIYNRFTFGISTGIQVQGFLAPVHQVQSVFGHSRRDDKYIINSHVSCQGIMNTFRMG